MSSKLLGLCNSSAYTTFHRSMGHRVRPDAVVDSFAGAQKVQRLVHAHNCGTFGPAPRCGRTSGLEDVL